MCLLNVWGNDQKSNKILSLQLQMSESPYPNLGSQPLLENQVSPLPPPPPPVPQNYPYNTLNPSPNPNHNPSFNQNPNPSFHQNPNPSFHQNPNPSFRGNPNPSFHNNPNPSFQNYPPPNYQPAYQPGNAPYNQGQVVASVGNHKIVSNNGGVYYNPGAPRPRNYAASPICPMCRRQTSSITRRVTGGVTWIWCFVLFVFTGICCCIPFCVDSCQDTEVVCVNCQSVKSRVQANCC